MVELDFSNGYGAVKRSSTLAAVREVCPGLAPLLASQWQIGATHAWAHNGEQGQCIAVDRGTWQGALASNPAFCCASYIALAAVLNADAKPAADASPGLGGVGLHAGLDGDCGQVMTTMNPAWTRYADDTVLFGPAESILRVWEDMGAT